MKKRVISASALIIIVLVCVFAGSYTRIALFLASGILCANELCKNLTQTELKCSFGILTAYLVLQAICVLFAPKLSLYCICFICSVYLAIMLGIFSKDNKGGAVFGTLTGLVYPCLLFGLIMFICADDIWLETLSIACVATWTCDSFALFGGKRFGKTKLVPEISPNKTVEGSICGAVFSLLAGLLAWLLGKAFGGCLFGKYTYMQLPLWNCMLTALIASSFGQLGDLAESLIKRMIGIKDFSDLIPGHGGMFDRADSLLFSIPAAYACLQLFMLI